ncbi:MAG: DUF4249 family protein [Balneolaceae bacterium]
MKYALIIFQILLLSLQSCEDYAQDSYEEQFIVEAYLVAGRPLPNVSLFKTVIADEKFNYGQDSYGVNNAEVEIRLLSTGPFSEIETVYSFGFESKGRYSTSNVHEVLPLRTYELRIQFPDTEDSIMAHTTVPDTFSIHPDLPDSIVYQSPERLQITLGVSKYPDRQSIFILNALGLNPKESMLTPFYQEVFESKGKDPRDLGLFANNSTGIINEGSFVKNEDGSVRIEYPWSGFSYFEDNLLVANAIDDNLYDFVRSQTVQLGGSSLSPGEIQNVIYNIEGGIGVFGALATDTAAIYLKRN